MKAMILAAGHGQRLKPLTNNTPKPLLEVGDKPLLAHQLSWLKNAGIKEVVINLHYLGDQIEAYCQNGEAFGIRIYYSYEDVLLETAGGIINALPLLGDEPFLLLNGDIFTAFPYKNLIDKIPQWSQAHLVLTPRPDNIDAGDFLFSNGKITSRGNDYTYCGMGVIRPAWLNKYPIKPLSLREPLFDAVKNGQVSGEIWEGDWVDIGSHTEFSQLNRRLGGK